MSSIIRAVTAVLSSDQRAQVDSAPGIRVWDDAEARTSSVGSLIVRDRFDDVSFGNDDGNDQWSADWIENDGASGGQGPASGAVVISSGDLRMDNNGVSSKSWVKREADLTGYGSATLSFSYRTSAGVDANDEVAVEVYYDGGWYSMLEQFGGLVGEQSGSKIYDISAFISADTKVRVRLANNYGGSNEYFYIDELQISASTGAGNGVVNRTVRDEFQNASWGNDDGPDNWVLDWYEDDSEAGGDGPGTGQVQIVGGELRLDDQPNTNGFPNVARRVDLSGVTDAMLSFDFRTSASVDSSDQIAVEISSGYTGCPMCAPSEGMYTVPETLDGLQGVSYGRRTFNISDYLSDDTWVRFRVTNLYGGSDEFFYVDNVEVRASSGAWSMRDEFNFPSFSANDGTDAWVSGWTEIGESDGPQSGGLLIGAYDNGTQQGLAINAPDVGVERSFDLSEATTAVLELGYISALNGAEDDFVGVQISNDGGDSWTELTRLTGAATQQFSADIAAYATADVRVRLLASSALSGSVVVDNVEISGSEGAQGSDPDSVQAPTDYGYSPKLTASDLLHDQGVTGEGVTIAVIDTGFWPATPLVDDTSGQPRYVVRYDAIRKEMHLGDDLNGHGTHVVSLMLNSSEDAEHGYHGIATDAGVVGVKAFDNDGRGSYANIIHALDWVVQNKDVYGIRVLNLSFSAETRSFYWDDPLN